MLVTVLSAELSGTVTFKKEVATQAPHQWIFHLLRLNKGEHVGKYGGVHGEACRVRRVRHHTEHVL